LKIVDVSDPVHPVLRGSYPTRETATKVIVQSNLAYMSVAHGSLLILDVSDPTAPKLRGSYTWIGGIVTVEVADSLAFVATADRKLLVVDISDPSRPLLRGSYAPPGLGYPISEVSDIQVVGDLVYIAESDAGMEILRLHPERLSKPAYLPMIRR